MNNIRRRTAWLRRGCVSLALLVTLSTGVQARSYDYRIDPVHSRIVVRAEHLRFSHAQGTVSGPTGWLRFDPKDIGSAEVDVEIDLSRVDFGDQDWNDKIAGRTWLNQEKFPTAQFKSERIETLDKTHFKVHGQLHFRGEARPLTLDVTFNRLGRHPLTLKRTAGFSARATFSRAAFGMDAWKSMVSDEIELQIEVEAQRKRRRTASEDRA